MLQRSCFYKTVLSVYFCVFISSFLQAQRIFNLLESSNFRIAEHEAFENQTNWYAMPFDQAMREMVGEQLELKPNARRKITFKLLKKFEKKHPHFFQGYDLKRPLAKDDGAVIAPEVDEGRAVTEAGKLLLLAKRSLTTTDTQLIQQQKMVREELMRNPSLCQQLGEQLQAVQEFEDAFISFWDDRIFTALVQRNIRIPFSYNKSIESWINLQPWAVEVRDKLQLATRMVVIPLLVKCGFDVVASFKTIYWNGLIKNNNEGGLEKHILVLLNPLLWLKFPFLFYVLTKSFGEHFENPLFDDVKNLEEYKSIGTPGEEKEYYQQIFALRSCLHKKLIALAGYLKGAQRLVELAQSNEVLRNNLFLLNRLNVDMNCKSKQIEKLLKLLKSSTFTGSPSAFNQYTGRVVVAYRLMSMIKRELAPLFVAVGELDTQLVFLPKRGLEPLSF